MEQQRVGAPASSPTLGLVLQMVPQLRHSCANITSAQNQAGLTTPGTKTLRLVNKLCRVVMKTEVHGFCLKLRSLFILSIRQPGIALQPLKAWQFLHGTQLHRLVIQVEGEESSPVAGASPALISACQLSHHTAQLQCFLDTVGCNSLARVTTLQLTFVSTSHSSHIPAPVTTAILRLIGAACPNVTHLVSHELDAQAVVEELGPLCPNICSFEVEESRACRSSAFILALRASFPNLSRLCAVDSRYMQHVDGWLALIKPLQELRCYDLPVQLRTLLSQEIRFSMLHTLHIQWPPEYWDVELLAKFLEAAPSLRAVSCGRVPFGENEESYTPACYGICVRDKTTPKDLEDLRQVVCCIKAGLRLSGVVLDCGMNYLPEDVQRLPVEHILSGLPALPSLAHCELQISDSTLAEGSLLQLGNAFPDITTLILAGACFTDAHLMSLSSFRQLRRLVVGGAGLLTAAGLVQCITAMPQVESIQLDSGVPLETHELEAAVESANAAAAAAAAAAAGSVGVGVGGLEPYPLLAPEQLFVEITAIRDGAKRQLVRRPPALSNWQSALAHRMPGAGRYL